MRKGLGVSKRDGIVVSVARGCWEDCDFKDERDGSVLMGVY